MKSVADTLMATPDDDCFMTPDGYLLEFYTQRHGDDAILAVSMVGADYRYSYSILSPGRAMDAREAVTMLKRLRHRFRGRAPLLEACA
jgi:hypothetical protein